MKRIAKLLVLTICLAALPATAQVSSEIDGIGIYFDLEGNEYCKDFDPAPLPGGELEAYLILTHASNTSGLVGWQCKLDIDTPPGSHVWSYEFATPAMNVSMPPNFAVVVFTPVPHRSALLLATITLHVLTPGAWTFQIYPPDMGMAKLIPMTWPVYMAADNPGVVIPMIQVSGGEDYPVAVLNGICGVVDDEATTWGALKVLYQ
ncbi:MAG: hypothetical protein ABIF77_09935 [bacterium]